MRIKRIVEEIINKYGTREPRKLVEDMDMLVTEDPLGKLKGYYIVYSGIKCICLNSDIKNKNEQDYIIAHEIGHSVMHEQERFMFYPNTLFSADKPEIEANRFATELLIPDKLITENPGVSKYEIARSMGFNEKIMDYKKYIAS